MATKSIKAADTRKRTADTRWKPDGWNRPGPFPLSFHTASGRLYKKIRGRRIYFGYGRDWRAALEAYEQHITGKPLPSKDERLTVSVLADKYLNVKRTLLDAGEITPRTFSEYYNCCGRVVDAFGKYAIVEDLTADDFNRLRSTLAKTRGPVALGNEIQRVKMIFKFGYDEGLISQPIRYGQSFNKPSKKVLRIAKASAGKRMFESEELRQILTALEGKPVTVTGHEKPVTLTADPVVRGMVLLAINCGFGAQDLASLPLAAFDLQSGYVDFARVKTGIPRRAKLWPETIEAVRGVMDNRPQPLDSADADLLFLTDKGKPWLRRTNHGKDPTKWGNRIDLIGDAFKRILDGLDINGRRGVYAIRHSFQTAAEASRDFPAVKYVMGHADASMSGVYRERIEDDRLEMVASTVRQWLWNEGGAK